MIFGYKKRSKAVQASLGCHKRRLRFLARQPNRLTRKKTISYYLEAKLYKGVYLGIESRTTYVIKRGFYD